MMPMTEINIGDIFLNPMHRGFGKLSGLQWCVVEKNDAERMIKLQATRFETGEPFGHPIWKKNKDRMFSESWRV